MIKTTVQVDGLMVLTGLGLIAVGLLYINRDKISGAGASALHLIDPTSSDNLAYRGANAVVGQDKLSTASDYLFGAIQLATAPVEILNLIRDGKPSPEFSYALKTYGLGG